MSDSKSLQSAINQIIFEASVTNFERISLEALVDCSDPEIHISNPVPDSFKETLHKLETMAVGIVMSPSMLSLLKRNVAAMPRPDGWGIQVIIDPRLDGDVGEVYYDQKAWGQRMRKQNIWDYECTRGPVSTRDGLLISREGVIQLPEADEVAQLYGFRCAEELVRHLEKEKEATCPKE